MDRAESSEDELEESTVDGEAEEERGKLHTGLQSIVETSFVYEFVHFKLYQTCGSDHVFSLRPHREHPAACHQHAQV